MSLRRFRGDNSCHPSVTRGTPLSRRIPGRQFHARTVDASVLPVQSPTKLCAFDSARDDIDGQATPRRLLVLRVLVSARVLHHLYHPIQAHVVLGHARWTLHPCQANT